MTRFSHVARTVALAASLAFSGAAMAKTGSFSSQLTGTNSYAVTSPAGSTPLYFSVLNVAGINSFEEIGSPANTFIELQFAPNAEIIGIGWDVILSAFAPSYLSEMVVALENSDLSDGVFLAVADGDDTSGLNVAYSSGGVIDLVDLGLNFNVGADGILRIEFFEDFDDDTVNPDGTWVSGNMTIEVAGVIPEPSTYGLMALGLLGVAGAVRRRRAA